VSLLADVSAAAIPSRASAIKDSMNSKTILIIRCNISDGPPQILFVMNAQAKRPYYIDLSCDKRSHDHKVTRRSIQYIHYLRSDTFTAPAQMRQLQNS
jgi:hypothetical protein